VIATVVGLASRPTEARAQTGPGLAPGPEQAPGPEPASEPAPTAPQARTHRVVVLPAEFATQIPEATRDEFEGALADGLARGGFAVERPPPRLRERGCATPECVRAVAAMAEADRAVRLSVSASARDYDVVIELFDAALGTVIAKTGERCELCGVAETRDVIASHAAAFRQRVDATGPTAPRLRIHTRPSGATVTIDGVSVGRAPVARTVSVGPHVVRAELPRHHAVERRVTAVDSVDEIVSLQLRVEERSRNHAMARAGWALLGVGAAALVTGIALVAIDGRENRVTCRGRNVDPLGNCRYLHNTKMPGSAVLATGLGMLGASIGLVAASSSRRTREAPTTAVTRRGLMRLAIRWR
jgi:hypothetical protein